MVGQHINMEINGVMEINTKYGIAQLLHYLDI